MEKIHGKSDIFTSDILINRINKYRKGEGDLGEITRTYNLRETVGRLTQK